MTNPFRGEVALTINGQAQVMRLTLGSLIALEQTLAEEDLVSLVQRFEDSRFRASDIHALLLAGLVGGGWDGNSEKLACARIKGGPMAAAEAAAQLLKNAFQPVCE